MSSLLQAMNPTAVRTYTSGEDGGDLARVAKMIAEERLRKLNSNDTDDDSNLLDLIHDNSGDGDGDGDDGDSGDSGDGSGLVIELERLQSHEQSDNDQENTANVFENMFEPLFTPSKADGGESSNWMEAFRPTLSPVISIRSKTTTDEEIDVIREIKCIDSTESDDVTETTTTTATTTITTATVTSVQAQVTQTCHFRGISIWLEPPEEDCVPFQATIDHLCAISGECSFVPHATVLYNIDPYLLQNGSPSYIRSKLHQCVSKFPSRYIPLHPKRLIHFPYPKSADGGNGFDILMPFISMKLHPSLISLFEVVKNNFPPDERHRGRDIVRYRSKSMGCISDFDNGGGVSVDPRVKAPDVKIEPIYDDIIPSQKNYDDDDDKGNNNENVGMAFKTLKNSKRSNSFHSLQNGTPYTPHFSIAYMHLSRTDIMNDAVCAVLSSTAGLSHRCSDNDSDSSGSGSSEAVEGVGKGIMNGSRAKYLTAWWTEGRVQDWKRICRVQIM